MRYYKFSTAERKLVMAEADFRSRDLDKSGCG
jgi:hypothetical protein